MGSYLMTFNLLIVYQSISQIRSIHDNCKEDRSWHFNCAYNPAAGHKCAWSHWANDQDDLLNFHCPHEGFITGVASEYNSRKRDRRWPLNTVVLSCGISTARLDISIGRSASIRVILLYRFSCCCCCKSYTYDLFKRKVSTMDLSGN